MADHKSEQWLLRLVNHKPRVLLPFYHLNPRENLHDLLAVAHQFAQAELKQAARIQRLEQLKSIVVDPNIAASSSYLEKIASNYKQTEPSVSPYLRQHHLLHLRSELLQINRTIAILVKLLEQTLV